jgi:hypothetical protein
MHMQPSTLNPGRIDKHAILLCCDRCWCRDVYKLLAKEADVTLARQPPLPDGSSSDNTTGSNDSTAGSAASSNSSSSSGSGGGTSARLGSLDVTDAAAAGVFSASAGDSGAVISAALLQGVEQYTVSLKPQPLVSHHD